MSACISAIDDDNNRIANKSQQEARHLYIYRACTSTFQGPEKERHRVINLHTSFIPHLNPTLDSFTDIPTSRTEKFLRLVSLHAHVQAQELCLAASHQKRRQEAKSTVVSLAKVLLSVIYSFTYSHSPFRFFFVLTSSHARVHSHAITTVSLTCWQRHAAFALVFAVRLC